MSVLRNTFQSRIVWLAITVAAPSLAAVAVQLWLGGAGAAVWMITGIPLLIITWLLATNLRRQVVFPLSTVSNLLEALREGDYSLRAKRAQRGDAIGELFWEINELTASLHRQRLRSEETGALVGKILANIDMAIFAFDAARNLRMVNEVGERLLASPRDVLLGKPAAELSLEDFLRGDASTIKYEFPGGAGTWDIRRAHFRENGIQQTLLVITDVSRALRNEERQAWQRLIRVLGHEINNSLTPVKSIAATLVALLERSPPPSDWRDDLRSGLQVIGSRADALNRFVLGYALLARLPAPQKRRVPIGELVSRVARLEWRAKVELIPGDDVEVLLDPDQIEQVLINLIKNACEATPSQGDVSMRWRTDYQALIVEIEDSGPGLSDTQNLFVPFFTTKPGGSGIGLVLARQIVDAHSGALILKNRTDGASGCVARIDLPL